MRTKLKDRTLDNDIKYSGFFSYRHLRIIAWICLTLAQISVVLSLEAKLNPASVQTVNVWKQILEFVGGLALPLFLLANFSNILSKKNNYRALFIFYGGAALGMYVLANFLVFHFGYRSLRSFDNTVDWGRTAKAFGVLLASLGKVGLTLNIFIDLLLCSLLFYFVNYNPKSKIFAGTKIIFFRLLALIPIAYEIVCLITKYQVYMGNIIIHSSTFFLLTSKPPLMFVAFICIVLGLKIGEIHHKKKDGNDDETYNEHVKTNAHSFKVSIMIATIFTIIAIIDLIIAIIVPAFDAAFVATENMTQTEIESLLAIRLDAWTDAGLGGSVPLIVVAPLALLFSYTKTHENKKIDMFIPIVGIALVLIVYIEGIFEVVTTNMARFIEHMQELFEKFIPAE